MIKLLKEPWTIKQTIIEGGGYMLVGIGSIQLFGNSIWFFETEEKERFYADLIATSHILNGAGILAGTIFKPLFLGSPFFVLGSLYSFFATYKFGKEG